MLEIRPLKPSDKPSWSALWQGYLDFYETSLSDDLTQSLWRRLHDDNVQLYGYLVVDQGTIIGLMHYVIHEATWTDQPVCYLEDLYVDSAARGKGAGRALIQKLLDEAKAQNWNRVYWHTHADNKNARALYDQFTLEGGFVKYAVYTDKQGYSCQKNSKVF